MRELFKKQLMKQHSITQREGKQSVIRSDPLAQTFIVTETGGCFLTKLDLYFAQKDNTLPVWVEVRNVVNGYPLKNLLPFGRKVLEPSDVNVDANTGMLQPHLPLTHHLFTRGSRILCCYHDK